MPAMRAMPLALPLLVTRVRADDEDPAVTPDDLALLAHGLDRRSDLHDSFRKEGDPAPCAAKKGAQARPARLAKVRRRPDRPERGPFRPANLDPRHRLPRVSSRRLEGPAR